MGTRIAPARKAALRELGRIRRDEAFARDRLRESREIAQLDVRDRALAERLVLGVVGCRGVLDEAIDAYVAKPNKLEPKVRDCLRLSCYELGWLSSSDAVVVSQGVELVRACSPHATGLANAVLHKLASEFRPRVQQARSQVASAAKDSKPEALPVETLALAAGFPLWLVKEFVASCGHDSATKICASQAEAAPVWVSPDPGRMSIVELAQLLDGAGIQGSIEVLPDVARLDSAAGLAQTKQVGKGIVVADFAARLVAAFASPKPGSHVLEIGQGRATKTVLLEAEATRAGGPCYVVGIDVFDHKEKTARRRLAGSWDAWCSSLVFDGCKLADPGVPEALDRTFDLVFLDAPCSGTGTLRRHPEIVWNLKQASVAPNGELVSLQRRLLEAASSKVAPGGTLVYATCSVLDQENRQVIEAFLQSEAGRDFELVDVDFTSGAIRIGEQVVALLDRWGKDGYFQSVPELGGCDGHFCACLERR